MKIWERYTKFEWRIWRVGKFQRIEDKVKMDFRENDLKECTWISVSQNELLLHDFVDKVLTF